MYNNILSNELITTNIQRTQAQILKKAAVFGMKKSLKSEWLKENLNNFPSPINLLVIDFLLQYVPRAAKEERLEGK